MNINQLNAEMSEEDENLEDQESKLEEERKYLSQALEKINDVLNVMQVIIKKNIAPKYIYI